MKMGSWREGCRSLGGPSEQWGVWCLAQRCLGQTCSIRWAGLGCLLTRPPLSPALLQQEEKSAELCGERGLHGGALWSSGAGQRGAAGGVLALRPSADTWQEPAVNCELLVQELSHVHGLYHKLKVSAFASTEQPVSSVQLIREDLVPELRRTMLGYHERQQRKVRHRLHSPPPPAGGAVTR